jgi:acyl-coenzyme A synthetase/AMP-(fatty) acid ligase/acyl carrier protein
MWMTVALFNRMSDADIEMFSPLGYLLVGGDALSPQHINRVREAFPGLRIINGYGPTENTTFSTTLSIDREYSQNIPIGSPIANSTTYVIDRNRKIVPIGVMGELYVGGDGVARGYLNNPELTAQRFIVNPLKEDERLYCTGDKVRWLKDGKLEFSGRCDHQVKIRGFRIELGEIESLLIKYPGVADTAVLAREDVPGEKRLVGYFVAVDKSEKFAVNELREFLEQRLPGYMVPSAFVEMEVLPLTPNGKINRKALPAPERSRQETGVEYIAPRTDTEETLVKIWCDVLHFDRIGMGDDFFQLGGHSLLATQVISRLRDEFKIELPIRSIFESPIAASLAEVVDNKISIKSENDNDTISFDSFEEGTL